MSCLQLLRPALHIPHFSIYILAFNKINQANHLFWPMLRKYRYQCCQVQRAQQNYDQRRRHWGCFSKVISFTHFLKMRRYLSGRGHSLINISLFSQDHRGTVNTLPKQWLSLPLEKEHLCADSSPSSPQSIHWPRRPGRTLTPRSTQTPLEPISSGLPHVSEFTLNRLHEERVSVAFEWNYTSVNSGDALCSRLFLFLMAMWKKYCHAQRESGQSSPRSSHCNHPIPLTAPLPAPTPRYRSPQRPI